MDKMEMQHKKEMTEMETQQKILSDKFEKLEKAVSQQDKTRGWWW